jgi:hypothetical protein
MAVHDELEVTTEQRMEAVRHPDMSVQHGLPRRRLTAAGRSSNGRLISRPPPGNSRR